MAIIAVAGGSGSVGKTIVDALQADGTHEVFIIARKTLEGDSVPPTISVDYENIDQITKRLDEHNIHTIISTIAMYDPVAAQSERNLITAAAASASVKRFVQSNWGDKTPEDESLRIGPNFFREQSLDLLRQTQLEWTQFHNGLFLDYYGIPHVESHLTPLVVFVDIANRAAAIPGDTGDEIVNFTYTKDLAKFVVAVSGLDKWDEVYTVYSDQASVKDIIQLAEEATGDKFTVTYDSTDMLRRDENTELPSHPAMYTYIPKPMLRGLLSKFGLWAVYGITYSPPEGSINAKFPHIKTTSVKEIIDAWRGH